MSLFVDDMFLYIENTEESINKLIQQENWIKDQYTKIIFIYASKIGKWNSLNITYISTKNQILGRLSGSVG